MPWPCGHGSQPWFHCSANPLTQSLLLCLMYPKLLEEGLMFAFLGWFLMPPPVTLGWPPGEGQWRGKVTQERGKVAQEPGVAQGCRWDLAWPPLLHSPGMARAGLGRIHCTFSLLLTKTKPGFRETKRLQNKPLENVFARVTLLWAEVPEWCVQAGRWSPFLFLLFTQLATWVISLKATFAALCLKG